MERRESPSGLITVSSKPLLLIDFPTKLQIFSWWWKHFFFIVSWISNSFLFKPFGIFLSAETETAHTILQFQVKSITLHFIFNIALKNPVSVLCNYNIPAFYSFSLISKVQDSEANDLPWNKIIIRTQCLWHFSLLYYHFLLIVWAVKIWN